METVGGCAPTSYIVQAGSSPGAGELANFSTGNILTLFVAPNVGSGRYFLRVRAATGAALSAPSNETIITVGGVDQTFLSYVSQPGDYIGGGRSARYTINDAVWSATVSSWDNAVNVSVHAVDYSFWWYLNLAAPNKRRITPGTYEAATRYPFQSLSAPGVSFYGDGRGCNDLTGRFTVTEIAYGAPGFLARLSATFEQHCSGDSPALFGEVRILADPWR